MDEVRKGQGDVKLTREEFERRLRERFDDPWFQKVERQIADVVDVAWKGVMSGPRCGNALLSGKERP